MTALHLATPSKRPNGRAMQLMVTATSLGLRITTDEAELLLSGAVQLRRHAHDLVARCRELVGRATARPADPAIAPLH